MDGSGSILPILDAIADIRALYQANENSKLIRVQLSLKEKRREQGAAATSTAGSGTRP